jgi:hypothetical protein
MSSVIKFEDLDIPALTLVAQEQYEECLWAIEKALTKQLEFGRVLLIVKAKLPHGEWGSWVRETFADHKSLRTIQRHMRGAEAIATDPSLLECADSLDGILKIVEARKPTVEVIEVAADVPVADEIVTEDKPAVEVITAVTTVKPVATNVNHGLQTAEPEVEKKSPSVIQIQHTLIKMGKDKKRHTQLMQIANDALHRLTLQDRGMVICTQLLSMKPEEREMVYASVDHMMKKAKPTTSGN